jgi:competence protein ComEA
MRILSSTILLLTAASSLALAQSSLPAGPGHDETVKVCGKCHAAEQAASLHQSRTGWEETISKMVNMGSEGTDEEYEAILNYLSKNFGLEAAKPISINKATAVELEAGLGLTRAESAAVVQYRTDKGNFKTVDDLKNVPGLDFKKVEARKARLSFQ